MKVLILWALLLFNGLLSFSANAIPVAWDNEEDGPWLTQESEHFVITYPERNTALADKSLNIAERVHKELLPFFGSSPSEKTQMVLVDDFDVSNGWATFFPFAQIRLYSTPPDTVSGLEESDDWLHTLIRHEYVHVLHMEMADGVPEFMRNIFGRLVVLFPHAITPSFMLEGLATYLETNEELKYGRLQSAYYAMQMRMEVNSGNLKTLSEVSAPLREWPLGMQYLYGSYFYQFLAQEYGEEKIKHYLKRYSRELIPAFFQNKDARQIFGKSFSALWEDYHIWLNEKFLSDIEMLNQLSGENKTLLRGKRTDFQGHDEGLFQDSSTSQGNAFYYIENTGEDRSKLIKADVGNQPSTEFLANTKGILTLDVNSQGGIVATRLIPWADGRAWADAFLLKNGSWKPLTTKQRLRNVRWLNNEWMIASRKEYGISQLVLLNLKGEQILLWQGSDEGDVIGEYDIDEQGTYLVAAIKRKNQGWNLERLNLVVQEEGIKPLLPWEKITQTQSIENNPQIMRDGRILYSANYDDVYNLYLLDPKTGGVSQLTQMLGGAFAPKFVRDTPASLDHTNNNKLQGEIVFQAYTETGFEFRQIKLRSAYRHFNIKDEQGQLDFPDPFSIEVAKEGPEPYLPWSTLKPTWWLPYAFYTAESTVLGAITAGTDALGRHSYSAQVSVDTQYNIANLNTSYVYDNRYQFLFDRSHSYNEIKGAGDYVVEQDRWIFSRLNMLNAIEDQLSLNSAVIVEREGSISRDDLLSVPCSDGNFNIHKTCEKSLIGLGIRFDNREAYLNSPGFSSGRYIDLVAETNDVLDSDYSGEVYQGQWLEIFDLPGRRSLSLQTLWGKTDKGGEDFTLGGESRGAESSLFGRDDFALRGYKPSVIGGQYFNVNRINYTQWLARIERGIYNWPVALGDISAKAFVDYGSAWDESKDSKYLTGVGVELNVEVLAFYNILLPISLSYAHGTDNKLGDDRFSVGVSLPY